MRTVVIYRERYNVVDDGHGGSDSETVDLIEDWHPVTGYSGDGWRESPVREAVQIISGEYLSYSADGGDWFGTDEPYEHPYGNDWQYERVTAHLHGFSEQEQRAVIRMVNWLNNRKAN